jgi:hypothetical protein
MDSTIKATANSLRTQREARGKYRANRRAPRTYVSASECVSYKLDADGNVTDAKIFKAAKATRAKVTRAPAQASIPETARFTHGHDYNG